MKKLLNGIARVLCVMSACVIAGCSYAGDGGNNNPPPVLPDVTPLANVTDLTAKCTANQTVKLTWTNPADTDFAKVVITYGTTGKVEVLKTATPNNEAEVTGLTNGTEYTFTVKAYDNAENASSGVDVKCKLGKTYTPVANSNGGLEGYSNQTQGEVIKETWMTDSGNLKIKGTEIAKTSEVVAIPTGTVAKINMTSSDAKGSLFTSSRKVKLSPFVMSKYPVTRGLFKAVMDDYYDNIKDNQATPTGTEDENPINYVNWFDAIVFCNKLSIACGLTPVYSYYDKTNPDEWFANTNLSATVPTGISSTNYSNWIDKVVINLKANGYRLPTEAEWEFAARGGNPNAAEWSYAYAGVQTKKEASMFIEEPYNDDELENYAWYDNNASNKTHEVGLKTENKLNLYDMSGNVYEWCYDWCYDWYNDTAGSNDNAYTVDGYVQNPLGSSSGTYRGRRGGYYYGGAYCCSVSYHNAGSPSSSYDVVGFRVCRSTQ